MNVEAEKFRKITMKVLTMQLNSITIMDLIAYGGAALGVIMAATQLRAGKIDLAGALLIVLLAAVWGGFLDGPLSVMNNVVWELLDNGTQYIDTIAYSAYYASAGAVI